MLKRLFIHMLLAGGLLLPVGCSLQEARNDLPPVNQRLENRVIARAVDIPFYRDAKSRELTSKKAQPLSAVMRRLAASPAGFVILSPKGEEVSEAELLALVEESGLNRGREVDISPRGALRAPGSPALMVTAVYYLYQSTPCGDYLPPRLLDRPRLASPNFGCAVEKNRMLSLSRAGDWTVGRVSDADPAELDALAVSRLFDGKIRPFIDQNNSGGGS